LEIDNPVPFRLRNIPLQAEEWLLHVASAQGHMLEKKDAAKQLQSELIIFTKLQNRN